MYSWIVKQVVRTGFAHLDRGDWPFVVRLFARDGTFAFPGEHDLAGEFHGRPAIQGWFARAFSMFAFHFEIHDVTAAGLPWNLRACTRFTVTVTAHDGTAFANHGVQYLRLRWGRVQEDRIFEDTQVAAAAVGHAVRLESVPATA
jgi:ketosteroid isomerase-like protein